MVKNILIELFQPSHPKQLALLSQTGDELNKFFP